MNNKQLNLLQEKITGIRTALFFCEDPEALPFRTHLVEIEKMDAGGFIWLSLMEHAGHSAVLNDWFPVKLEFYRKGMAYHININGRACIAEKTSGKLLLKIEIQKARFTAVSEPGAEPSNNGLMKQCQAWWTAATTQMLSLRDTKRLLQTAVKKAAVLPG